jgi:hypothetical protein
MPRFFFDHRDGNDFIRDDDGLELASVENAREEATSGLAGIVRDTLPCAIGREIAVEVSDENQRPLFRVRVWSQLELLS